MSLKIRGLLMDRFSSRLEQSYANDSNVIKMQDVPCSMTFAVEQGFMDNEPAKHHFLPVFHMMGQITEIRGDFPCDVSCLYFGPEDKGYLYKDCAYYPEPHELAYLITKGGFFTDKFKLPNVLTTNSMSFPALVDLVVIPPNIGSLHTEGMSKEDLDKLSVPIVYVRMKGTGVTKRTDRLLDYYGIEADPNHPSYFMTMEASGYNTPENPGLLTYVEELVQEQQLENDLTDEDYFYDGEDVIGKKPVVEDQVQANPLIDMPTAPLTQEDMMLEQASRDIHARVEEKREQKRLHKESVRQMQETADKQVDRSLDDSKESTMKENVVSKEIAYEDSVEPVVSHTEESVKPVYEEFVGSEQDSIGRRIEDVPEPEEPIYANMQSNGLIEPDTQEEEKVIRQEAAEPVSEAVLREDVLNEQYHVETNDTNDDSHADEEYQDVDQSKLEDLNGGDVADIDDQKKLDEARQRKLARDTAVDVQQEMSDKKEFGRAVPAKMEEIGAEYDRLHSDMDMSIDEME